MCKISAHFGFVSFDDAVQMAVSELKKSRPSPGLPVPRRIDSKYDLLIVSENVPEISKPLAFLCPVGLSCTLNIAYGPLSFVFVIVDAPRFLSFYKLTHIG